MRMMSPGSSVMPFGEIDQRLGQREHHIRRVVRLHDVAVEPAHDLEPLAAGRQLVGAHHPRPEAAGAVEILAHAPLRGVALEFAHRAFVRARIAGDAGERIVHGQMLGALAHDRDHFGFVIELGRYARADDRLQMRHHRRQHAEEDRREFRNIVALRPFLDVVEIIEAEADDLAGLCDRETEFQSGERTAGGGRRLFGEIGQGFEVAVARPQGFAEIAGRGGVHRLQIDDGVALDHAEPQAVIRFKTDNLHCVPALTFCCGERLSAGRPIREDYLLASVKAWIEKYLRSSVHTPAGCQPAPRASAPSDSTLYL